MKNCIYIISLLILISSCKENTEVPKVDNESNVIFQGNIENVKEIFYDTLRNWEPLLLDNEIQSYFDTILPNEILARKINIEKSTNAHRINVEVVYGYTHRQWEKMLMEYILFDMKEKQIYSLLNLEKKVLLFSIYFQIEDGENESRTTINHDYTYKAFKELKWYKDFCRYAITKMTPSDFQAYDYAFDVLFERTKDESFNSSFYKFYCDLSGGIINPNDKKMLHKLIDWTEERGDIEKPDHFEYLLHFYDNIEMTNEEIDN